VAKYNPDYLAAVEAERQRLGSNHPLFLTQYCLLPVKGAGGMFLRSRKRSYRAIMPANPRRTAASSTLPVSTWPERLKRLRIFGSAL